MQITVPFKDKFNVLNAENWPEDLIIKPFWFKNKVITPNAVCSSEHTSAIITSEVVSDQSHR